MSIDALDPDVDLDELRRIVEEAIETFTELGDEPGLAEAEQLLRHSLLA